MFATSFAIPFTTSTESVSTYGLLFWLPNPKVFATRITTNLNIFLIVLMLAATLAGPATAQTQRTVLEDSGIIRVVEGEECGQSANGGPVERAGTVVKPSWADQGTAWLSG